MLVDLHTVNLQLFLKRSNKVALQVFSQTIPPKNQTSKIEKASKSLCLQSKPMILVHVSQKLMWGIYLLVVLMIKGRSKNRGSRFLPMEIFISVDMNLTVPKVMDSIIGKMDQTIEDSFSRG